MYEFSGRCSLGLLLIFLHHSAFDQAAVAEKKIFGASVNLWWPFSVELRVVSVLVFPPEVAGVEWAD
ncbi:hypothetical protein BaRGS_00012457, partial [Batillaria attramentaria]